MKWTTVGAKQLERATKNDGRGDAIAIVVAMDRDALFPLDRRENPLHRRRHIGELERIVQMIERRMEKPLRQLRRIDPANRQQASNGRTDPQLARQHLQRLRRCRPGAPRDMEPPSAPPSASQGNPPFTTEETEEKQRGMEVNDITHENSRMRVQSAHCAGPWPA